MAGRFLFTDKARASTQYRYDTAAGSDTPAVLVGPYNERLIAGSALTADITGRIAPFRGPAGVAVLWRKPLLNGAVRHADAVQVLGVGSQDESPDVSPGEGFSLQQVQALVAQVLAVTSVVGQSGAVTGAQILADGAVAAALAAKASDSSVVHLGGAETVSGAKSFTSPVAVSSPTQNAHAATKSYVDAAVAGGAGAVVTIDADGTLVVDGVTVELGTDAEVSAAIAAASATTVHLTGAETISGLKTFSTSPVVPTPTASGQAAPKSYVDTNTTGVLRSANNLSDVASPAAARSNLGLAGTGVQAHMALGVLGAWYEVMGAQSVAGGAASTPAGTARVGTPLTVPEDMTIDAIGCYVSAAGSAGALVRLGLITPNSSNPFRLAANSPYGTLLLDAGTIEASSGVGPRIITLATPLTLTRGQMIAGIAAMQVASASLYASAGSAGSSGSPWGTNGNLIGNGGMWGAVATGITGALPATFTPTTTTTSGGCVWIRRSA